MAFVLSFRDRFAGSMMFGWSGERPPSGRVEESSDEGCGCVSTERSVICGLGICVVQNFWDSYSRAGIRDYGLACLEG